MSEMSEMSEWTHCKTCTAFDRALNFYEGMCAECWAKRAGHWEALALDYYGQLERTRAELERVQADANNRIVATGTRLEDALKELERERKVCAALGKELRWLMNVVDLDAIEAMHKGSYMRLTELLLSDDAGRDYRHKDEYKPLVEALKFYTNCTWMDPYNSVLYATKELLDDMGGRAKYALSDARAKGLL